MPETKPSSLPDPRPPGNYSHSTTPLLIYALTLTLIFLATLSAKTLTLPIQAQENPDVSPSVSPSASPTVKPIPSPTPTEEPLLEASEDLIQQREAIRQYINVIFGSQGKTAFAIALAESGRSYKGERVFNVDAMHVSDVECSVGVFQVNLRSREAKVHWARVPGQTETEKIEWLKNPYNNILMAYWIYSTHNNFEPWSVFSDGTYLAYAK